MSPEQLTSMCSVSNSNQKNPQTRMKSCFFPPVKPECGITQTESSGRQVLICTAHANPGQVDFTWRIKNENETVDDPIENRGLESYLTLESRVDNFRTYLCYANNSVGMSVPCERDVTGVLALIDFLSFWHGCKEQKLISIISWQGRIQEFFLGG